MKHLLALLALASSVLAAPPVRTPSFGPNGTHWPNPDDVPPSTWNANLPASIATPYPGDTYTNTINVACSWSAIRTALQGLTSTQVQQGVIIKVAPGTLPGNGTALNVLNGLGSTAWAQRVTICPRDGFGTVTVSTYATIENVDRVAFVGFIFWGVEFVGCRQSALIWSWISDPSSQTNISSNVNRIVTHFEMVEVVFGGAAVTADVDRVNVVSSRAGGATEQVRFDGCFFWPKYKLLGTTKHTDTLQFNFGVTGWLYYPRNIYMRDNYFPGTYTATIQRPDRVHFEHNLFVLGTAATARGWIPTPGSTGQQAGDWTQGYHKQNVAIDNWILDGAMGTSRSTSSNDASPTAEWRYIAGNRGNSPLTFRLLIEEGTFTQDPTVMSEVLPPAPTYELMGEWWDWGSGGTPPPLPTPTPSPSPTPTPTPSGPTPTPTPSPTPTPTPTPGGPTPTPTPSPTPEPTPIPPQGLILINGAPAYRNSDGSLLGR